MGCCKSKVNDGWEKNFIETELSSNKCDALWEKFVGENATFGMSPHFAPCARFGILSGVIRCKVGFAGGTEQNPSYDNVGDHALALNVEFDPKKIKYEQLLEIFWNYHDIFLPSETTENQSTIFYRNEEQMHIAEENKLKEQEKHIHEILTVIKPFTTFFDASEEYQHFNLQANYEVMSVLEKKVKPTQMAHSHLACKLEGYVSGYASPENFDVVVSELYIPENVAALVRSFCVSNQVAEPGSDRMNDWG